MAPPAGSLDERRIQEIVERVISRLGSDLPATPADAIERAAAKFPKAYGQPLPSEMPKREVRVPRGKSGIYPAVDSAVKAARKAYEQHERASLETRDKIVTAMRETTLKHVKELAQYAVDET